MRGYTVYLNAVRECASGDCYRGWIRFNGKGLSQLKSVRKPAITVGTGSISECFGFSKFYVWYDGRCRGAVSLISITGYLEPAVREETAVLVAKIHCVGDGTIIGFRTHYGTLTTVDVVGAINSRFRVVNK